MASRERSRMADQERRLNEEVDDRYPIAPPATDKPASPSYTGLQRAPTAIPSPSQIEDHPLYPLLRNAMIETSLTGILSPQEIRAQLTPLAEMHLRERYERTPANPDLDDFMLVQVHRQRHFQKELMDLQRLCDDTAAAAIQSIQQTVNLSFNSNLAIRMAAPSSPVDLQATPPVQMSPFSAGYVPQSNELIDTRMLGVKRPLEPLTFVNHRSEAGGRRLGRGHLSVGGVEHLRRWIVRNWRHPYPSEAVKEELMAVTGFSKRQVNNWFINSRRRLIKKTPPAELAKMAEELSYRTDNTAVIPSPGPANSSEELTNSTGGTWFEKQQVQVPGMDEPPAMQPHYEGGQHAELPSLMCMPGINQTSDSFSSSAESQ